MEREKTERKKNKEKKKKKTFEDEWRIISRNSFNLTVIKQ